MFSPIGCSWIRSNIFTPESKNEYGELQSSPWILHSDIEVKLIVDESLHGQEVDWTILSPGTTSLGKAGPASEHVGLSGVQLTWLSPQDQQIEAMLAAASGARYIGLDFDWRKIEPKPDQFDWNEIDRVVELAKRYNLVMVPMLLYTPSWASSVAFAPMDYQLSPPTRFEDYRDFVYRVVKRYKPYGDAPFTLDGYGITDWVIWNEPNTHLFGQAPNPGKFWTGSIDEYIRLLRAGYDGAHSADPGCNVLNGGLSDVLWTDDHSDILSSLERFYDPNGDGDASDGGRPFFDTLNIHLYQLDTPDPLWYQRRLDKIAEIMQRFGDSQKRIWITETGYGSLNDPSQVENRTGIRFLDEDRQAEAVRMVYSTCLQNPQVEKVFWWSLRDYYYESSGNNEAMEAHYGLIRADFSPKPAYMAYAQLTGAVDQVLMSSTKIDDLGIAEITVPASFVDQPGSYVVFADPLGRAPAIVAVYPVEPEVK
jgi:hypothetical protein